MHNLARDRDRAARCGSELVSHGDDHIAGRFEEVSGSFKTKSGWFKLKDTSVYGDISGRLLENRKIELLESGSAAESPGSG